MEDNEIALLDKLFSEQALYEPLWKKYELLYEAKFDDEYYKKLKKKRRSRVFVPVVRNTTNIIIAIFSTAFFSRGNPIEIIPTNESEKELVTYRNKLLNYYYNQYKPSKELIKSFLSACTYGMGIVTTYWDREKEKVITTHIPITDLAFDNECTSIDDIEILAYKHYESVRVTLQKIENKYYNQKGLKKKLFGDETPKTYFRNEVKTLYRKKIKSGWNVKTYINNILVRDKDFKYNPFQYGYAIPKLPSIDMEKRKDQILCYGDTIPNYLKELQKEINYKRNVKNDIQEKILNPDVYVADTANIEPSELNYGAGKRIRVKGKITDIKERAVPSEYALNNDLGMLAGDVQSAIGVNSIQEGKTGASDRRSANAMAVVNNNSSMRIEQMIMLLKDTLFEHWAKTWVNLVMANASDDVIHKVTGRDDFPLGKYGERDEIKYDLQINFGMTLDKQEKINSMLQAYQMASQNPSIRPHIVEGLLKDLLMLIVGDDTNLTELFEKDTSDVTNTPPTPEEIADQEAMKDMLNGAL